MQAMLQAAPALKSCSPRVDSTVRIIPREPEAVVLCLGGCALGVLAGEALRHE